MVVVVALLPDTKQESGDETKESAVAAENDFTPPQENNEKNKKLDEKVETVIDSDTDKMNSKQENSDPAEVTNTQKNGVTENNTDLTNDTAKIGKEGGENKEAITDTESADKTLNIKNKVSKDADPEIVDNDTSPGDKKPCEDKNLDLVDKDHSEDKEPGTDAKEPSVDQELVSGDKELNLNDTETSEDKEPKVDSNLESTEDKKPKVDNNPEKTENEEPPADTKIKTESIADDTDVVAEQSTVVSDETSVGSGGRETTLTENVDLTESTFESKIENLCNLSESSTHSSSQRASCSHCYDSDIFCTELSILFVCGIQSSVLCNN